MRVLILGAGGHGQVVADIALSMVRAGTAIEVIGFLDDDRHSWGQCVLGIPVLGPTQTAPPSPFDAMVVGIGDNRIRRQLYQYWAEQGVPFATLIHPNAVVAQTVRIGSGTVLCAGVIVNTGSRIGSNAILNTACSIDHHNVIGDHVHIAPGARLGGDVRVAEGALVGIGAVVLPQRQIGEWAKAGAGAVVTHNVLTGQTVTGVPAKPRYSKS